MSREKSTESCAMRYLAAALLRNSSVHDTVWDSFEMAVMFGSTTIPHKKH
jgi:hypothetical protein